MSDLALFSEQVLPHFSEIDYFKPQDIETESMRIIDKELTERGLSVPEAVKPIVYRAIHTTADFDYAQNLVFSSGLLPQIKELFTAKKPVIVTDTTMALSGINKTTCASLGIETHCFMADSDVKEQSKKSGLTRAVCSVDKAVRLFSEGERPLIFACGNAPTALVRIRQLYDAGFVKPALVVGVPVGFVNVVAAKELIIKSNMPYIVAKGRKGGSTVAAAIINALLYMHLTE